MKRINLENVPLKPRKGSLCDLICCYWMSRWVFSCCRGVQSKNNLPGVIWGKWVEGERFTLVVFYSSKWCSRVKIKVEKYSYLWWGGQDKFVEVIWKYHPLERKIWEREGPILYIIFQYAQLFNIQYTSIMKWWGMVIHSIAPRLKKHVYLGYLRKVFEPSVIQWQATQSCWCIARIPLFCSGSYFTALRAEE